MDIFEFVAFGVDDGQIIYAQVNQHLEGRNLTKLVRWCPLHLYKQEEVMRVKVYGSNIREILSHR